MTISKFTPHTAVATGTNSLSVIAPASLGAGEISWLLVGVKPETATVVTPSGWTAVLDVTGGTGTFGIDTGPTRLALFRRDGAFTGPVAVTVTSGDTCWGQIESYSKDPLLAWDCATASGNDTTGASAVYDATCSTNPGWVTGDVPLAAACTPTDAHSGVASLGLNAIGITGGAVNAYRNVTSGTGNDIGGVVLDRIGATGTASTAPQVLTTFTGATNTYGPCIVVRMREVTPPGQTVAINQVSETDMGLSLARLKTLLIGRVSESDIGLTLARSKARMLGQVVEADLIQVLTRRKTKLLVQASEADTVQTLGRRKVRVILQVAETDLAQGLGRRKALAIGRVAELDTAQHLVTVAVRREYWGAIVLR